MSWPIVLRCRIILFPLWAIAVSAGLFAVYYHEHSPSVNAAAPARWQEAGKLVRSETKPTLLVFLHPHCPCSRATVSELEKLTARTRESLSVGVIFLHPDEVPPDWHQTALCNQAFRIPGVRLIDDVCCRVTQQFGVSTSGQALLYGVAGDLLFCGGLTSSRGHAGDNPGCDAIMDAVRGKRMTSHTGTEVCAVYGCPLFASTRPDTDLSEDMQ